MLKKSYVLSTILSTLLLKRSNKNSRRKDTDVQHPRLLVVTSQLPTGRRVGQVWSIVRLLPSSIGWNVTLAKSADWLFRYEP